VSKKYKRKSGWYVADATTGNCHGGPYEHEETAYVVRDLREQYASNSKNELWNLTICDSSVMDEYDDYYRSEKWRPVVQDILKRQGRL